PGKPQQNGRHERFHRTLKDETASPPKANARAQQRAFDVFRREYNEERPHEALGQRAPARLFVPSNRTYPGAKIRLPDPAPWNHAELVRHDGTVRWGPRRIFISSALHGELVEFEPDHAQRW